MTRRLASLTAVTIALLTGNGALRAQTVTPTPRPRLTGGFGRARETPVPGTAGGGQSLADVVRAAQEARGGGRSTEKEKPGVTINNRSLVTNPEKGRVSTSKIVPAKTAPPAPAPSRPAPAVQAAPTPASGFPETAGTEEEWRTAAQRARARVGETAARVTALEAEAKKLENEFYAWDDGQYRDRVIKPSWDRAREELEQARAEHAAAQKDLADLPEKARRAGALPGWIRE